MAFVRTAWYTFFFIRLFFGLKIHTSLPLEQAPESNSEPKPKSKSNPQLSLRAYTLSSTPSHPEASSSTPTSSPPFPRQTNQPISHPSPTLPSEAPPLYSESTQPTRLHIRSLPFSITRSADLALYFARFGHLTQVFMPTDNFGRPAGYGFVEFISPEDARRAKDEMDGCELEGRTISVQWARTSRKGVDKQQRARQREVEIKEFWREREERARVQNEKEAVFHRYIKMKDSGELEAKEAEQRRRSVFVGNAWGLEEHDFRDAFAEYGVVDVRFPYNGQDEGYVHVELEREEDAIRMTREMEGLKVKVRDRYVWVQRPKVKHPNAKDRGGQKKGGLGRFGEGSQ